jgi:hypothetical protein
MNLNRVLLIREITPGPSVESSRIFLSLSLCAEPKSISHKRADPSSAKFRHFEARPRTCQDSSFIELQHSASYLAMRESDNLAIPSTTC